MSGHILRETKTTYIQIRTSARMYRHGDAVRQGGFPLQLQPAAAPPVPLPPGQPAGRNAWVSSHFFSCLVAFLLRSLRSETVGNITSGTATEQSILEIASMSSLSESQQQQQSFQAKFQPSLHLSSPPPFPGQTRNRRQDRLPPPRRERRRRR